MGRTAYDEYFGCSLQVDISENYQIGLSSGQGGCRYFSVRPDRPDLYVQLPDARFLQPGGAVQPLIENDGTDDFIITDAENNELIVATIGNVYECRLLANATMSGLWLIREFAIGSGSVLLAGRVPLQRTFSAESIDSNLFNLFTAEGYDGVTPAAARATIAPSVVLGSSSTALGGLDTGSWPAGSTLLLLVGSAATTSGKGGAAGRGGDVPPGLLAQNGSAGGPGLIVRVPTVLNSYGTIQGGGGGGGGGARVGTVPGGGGGGGAGHQLSAGGDCGREPGGTTGGATPGYSGSLFVAGGGGAGGQPGGSGGGPGQAGDPGGALGGAAGDAIRRLSTVTLTKLRAGTILGAEVVF